MTEHIGVAFDGADSGEAPLTWGQQHIWDWIRRSDSPLSMSAVRPLEPGATIAEFVDELRFFMGRFQAMRTRLGFDEHGRPHQLVARSGEVPMEIVDVGDGTDPAEVAEAISLRHKASHFDYPNEWPIRMALVRRAGVLTHLVTTLCHVVVDSAAAMVMFTDLLARADSPVSMGPLELAQWQQSEAGRRQSELALRYWEKELRAMPAARAAQAVEGTRYWQYDCESPALYLALRCLADRLGGDTAPLVLACYAVALARMTGQDSVALTVFASNRFRLGLTTVVSPVNQAGLCVLHLAGLGFDELVGHVRRRTMSAYKNAYYDQFERDALIGRIGQERGVPLDLECWVNDRRTVTTVDSDEPLPGEAEVRAAQSRFTVERTPLDLFIRKLMFTINDGPETVPFTIEADTTFIPLAELEALVREIEAVAVEAAFPSPADMEPGVTGGGDQGSGRDGPDHDAGRPIEGMERMLGAMADRVAVEQVVPD